MRYPRRMRVPRRAATSFVVLAFAVFRASCGRNDQSVAASRCPPPGTGLTSEQCLRPELGIPPDATRAIIFSQSSHLDWDWLLSFDDYFTQRVEPIFEQAFGPADPPVVAHAAVSPRSPMHLPQQRSLAPAAKRPLKGRRCSWRRSRVWGTPPQHA